jgi:hypothetical protein
MMLHCLSMCGLCIAVVSFVGSELACARLCGFMCASVCAREDVSVFTHIRAFERVAWPCACVASLWQLCNTRKAPLFPHPARFRRMQRSGGVRS